MTTIAWRPYEIAGDTAIFENNTIVGHVRKISRRGPALIGAAGIYAECQAFLKWVKGNGQGARPKMTGETTGIVGYDTMLHVYDANGVTLLRNCPYYAIGNGSDFATGAMAAGASAKEAVKIAMKHNAFTKGKVQVLYE